MSGKNSFTLASATPNEIERKFANQMRRIHLHKRRVLTQR